MELVPLRPDRPAFITIFGTRIYVAIHDAEVMRQWIDWKRELTEAHPDRGGTHAKFVAAHAKYERWEAREAQWYRQYGLTPPWEPRPRFDYKHWETIPVVIRREIVTDAIKRCGGMKRACKQFGVSRNLILRWCQRYGIDGEVGRQAYTEHRKQRNDLTLAILSETANASETARRLGLSHTSVLGRVQRAGMLRSWSQKKAALKREEIIRVLSVSYSMTEAAQRLGIPKQSLASRMKTYRINWREHVQPSPDRNELFFEHLKTAPSIAEARRRAGISHAQAFKLLKRGGTWDCTNG